MSKNANTNNSYLGDEFLDEDMIASVDLGVNATHILNGGTSSANWAWNSNTAIDYSNITIGPSSTIIGAAGNFGTMIRPDGRLELQGEDADIKINGRSLMNALDALEQRLNILVPNPELETEWDELRVLGERYRALEKQCAEKGNMWKKLKSMPSSKP